MKRTEAGWYVMKAGEGFMVDGEGVRWFGTAGAAMAAADLPAEYSWLDYRYRPPLGPNAAGEEDDELLAA